jgi:hypothetical protein
VADEHIMMAPCSNGMRSGRWTAFRAGHGDRLGEAAVHVVAEHRRGRAVRFIVRDASLARAARDEVVETHAVAHRVRAHVRAHALDDAGDLVPERQRQRSHGREAAPVVRVRVADAGGAHAHEHLAGTGLADGDVLQLQRPGHRGHANGSHRSSVPGMAARVRRIVRAWTAADRRRKRPGNPASPMCGWA